MWEKDVDIYDVKEFRVKTNVFFGIGAISKIDEIAKNSVAVNVHFIPMPMLSFFKEMGYCIKNYPTAYNNFKSEISLPIYPQLKDNEVEYVIDTILTAYHKAKKT